MRFDPTTAHLIADRKIRELRLPAQEVRRARTRKVRGGGRHALPANPHTHETAAPQVGHAVPITRPGSRAPIAHITITSCRRARHGDTLSAEQLKALGHVVRGHPSRLSYVRAWLLQRDAPWLAARAPLPRTTTQPIKDAALAAVDDEPEAVMLSTREARGAALLARFDQRWADRYVWVVTFEITDDLPTYLHQGVISPPLAKRPDGRHVIDDGIRDEDRGYYGAGVRPVPSATELEDRGYTHNARDGMTAAAEAVDVNTLDPERADEARERHLQDVDPARRAKLLKAGLRRAA